MRQVYTLMAVAAVVCGCAHEADYDACGTFEATEVLVSSQGTGQLLWFDATEGETVEPGQVLGVIDTVQISLQKAQVEAQLQSVLSSRPDIESQVSSIRSQISKCKTEKKRLENLLAKGAAPQKQLDDVDSQIEVLENQLNAQMKTLSNNSQTITHNAAALSAQLALLEDCIAKCKVSSPVQGTVIAKYVNKGELVAAGTPVMKVADLDNMYLRAYFTSDQLAELKLGDVVTVIADYGADKQFQYSGKISWISAQSEFTPKSIQTRNTRANLVYAVKIAIENDGRLKLGMYGEVKL